MLHFIPAYQNFYLRVVFLLPLFGVDDKKFTTISEDEEFSSSSILYVFRNCVFKRYLFIFTWTLTTPRTKSMINFMNFLIKITFIPFL